MTDSLGSKRILVVEDDKDIASLLEHHFQRAGYETEVLHSGNKVVSRISSDPPDLLVLDLMLPGLGGLDVCRSIRATSSVADLPIIMLTAKSEETDKLVGLEIGADDYVTKPFSPKELIARVGAVLRRVGRGHKVGGLLRFGALVVDNDQHVVSIEGEDVKLTAKEFSLLSYLVKHRGRVLSRDVLLSDVWGYTYTGGTRTVDVHIRRLREKIPTLAASIVTVKQFGYKLTAPVSS